MKKLMLEYETDKKLILPMILRITAWTNLVIGWIAGAGFATEFNMGVLQFIGLIWGGISAVTWYSFSVIVEACYKYIKQK